MPQCSEARKNLEIKVFHVFNPFFMHIPSIKGFFRIILPIFPSKTLSVLKVGKPSYYEHSKVLYTGAFWIIYIYFHLEFTADLYIGTQSFQCRIFLVCVLRNWTVI